jgi:hypothetical protein
MRIQAAKRLMTLKVVYYGPGLSGKTTNLATLHRVKNDRQRGALVQLDTESERTLFFDYFPVVLGRIGGFDVKVDFFTVPGQSFYTKTRLAVLDGADGVVFVADSSARREAANLQSRADLVAGLAASGRAIEDVPHVYQWNKRDADDALEVAFLSKLMNPEGAPELEAIATTGEGVVETERTILKTVVASIQQQMAVARGA